MRAVKKIAVIGTGYVGLVSGTCFAEIGNKVICCDINESKIRSLKNGVIPIYEPGLADLVEKNVLEQRLSFTNDIPSAIRTSDIIYIAVGTPMSKTGEADLTYVKASTRKRSVNISTATKSLSIKAQSQSVPENWFNLSYKKLRREDAPLMLYPTLNFFGRAQRFMTR